MTFHPRIVSGAMRERNFIFVATAILAGAVLIAPNLVEGGGSGRYRWGHSHQTGTGLRDVGEIMARQSGPAGRAVLKEGFAPALRPDHTADAPHSRVPQRDLARFYARPLKDSWQTR
jgi:hypothetical protein